MLAFVLTDSFWETVNAAADTVIYFWLAMIATGLFVIRLVLMLLFGVDDGMDIDTVDDVDVDHGGLGLFSIFSILSFMMGAGWMGLFARMEWGLGTFTTSLCALGFGTVLLLMAAFMLNYIRSLHQSGTYDINSAVGKIGKVNLTIPQGGSGAGEVQVTVSGRQKVLPAKTRIDQPIESFTTVRILEIEGGHTLIVEPA